MTTKDFGSLAAPPTPPRLLYDPAKAADILDVSRARLYRWLSDGRIPSVKIGRSRRISRAALEEFVRSLETDADAQPR